MIQQWLPVCGAYLIYCALCSGFQYTSAQATSTEISKTTTPSSINIPSAYAWSVWGKWSSCSKTCGGGVAVQERQCLPREPGRKVRSRRKRKLSKSYDRLRKTRQIVNAESNQDCPGIGKRYHECNTAPCPGQPQDSRAVQCATYDRRPFHGHFYTWVPYIDGVSPCTLNCRPRGQQFYASLALVADGTECTKPGFRAICVQGECKVVGRDAVLASVSSVDIRCGNRLVSGVFSRPRLPLGYSHVTTIPRGACSLNVSETVPLDNYIALKVQNGSYIMNGEFAVSAPGSYDAAGARFHYTRAAGRDHVYCAGPLHQPVDIMILYTQSNPSIKYEYLTDTHSDDTSNDIPTSDSVRHHPAMRHHRHHIAESESTRALDRSGFESQSQIESNIIGDRKFVWKIMQFTQCSRSCGGGLQIGKFKCAEVDGGKDKEVSPANCKGAPPSSKRRRCGGAACSARWRITQWDACPVCANRNTHYRKRVVSCVQDHSRGITKISDHKCPQPAPPNRELCNIPTCNDEAVTTESTRSDSRRQIRPVERTENFREGPVISLATVNSSSPKDKSLGPSYNFEAAGGWLYTEWSNCVGWCVGGGTQTRGIRCSDPSGCPATPPLTSQSCTVRSPCQPQWLMGEWSPCTATCDGRQVRTVVCIGGNGRRLRDKECGVNKPASEQACGETCMPEWFLSDWSECTGPCSAAVQSRRVWCAGSAEGAGGVSRDSQCSGTRPSARRNCVPRACSAPAVPVPPRVTDSQQRVTRHQSQNVQNTVQKSYPPGSCMDKLSNCVLAVQARLCHYPYYGDQCCKSCLGR